MNRGTADGNIQGGSPKIKLTVNEVLKTLLVSETETGDRLRTQANKLMTENDHFRTLLAFSEC